ncbi:peptide IlvX [Enterobacter asburiae]|nr:peptide IlvX [Enterobacter asburiae]UAN38671.1 peptide IlvX [Enterobacter asburiae]
MTTSTKFCFSRFKTGN